MQAKRRLPTLPGDALDDKTSERPRKHVQLVQGPYRDASDAKLQRKREIDAWLQELDEAESLRAARLREKAMLEESVQRERQPLLARIRVKTPCKESWEAMAGSESRRHCERCKRDVYDLSEMTRAEVEALFAREATTPCVRLRLRPDGRVATSDCPIEPSRMPLMMSAALGAMSAVAVGGAVALACLPQLGGAQPVDYAEERRAFEREIEAIEASTTQRAEAQRQADQEASRDAERRRQQHAPEADIEPMMGEPMIVESAPVGLDSERIGHNEYVVSRSFLERMVTTRQPEGRAVPHEQNGIAFGMRIYGLRRRGELEQLGFRNGDVVLRMNGISVSGASALTEIATAIQSSTVFAVDVLRAGRVMTLRYTVLG